MSINHKSSGNSYPFKVKKKSHVRYSTQMNHRVNLPKITIQMENFVKPNDSYDFKPYIKKVPITNRRLFTS